MRGEKGGEGEGGKVRGEVHSAAPRGRRGEMGVAKKRVCRIVGGCCHRVEKGKWGG